MSELQDTLPPGWDCRYDIKTGKPYFINHYTKSTTWEDPRNRHKLHSTPLHVQNASVEYIPLQDMRSNSRMSPLLLQTSNTQDSSLTNVPDTDDSVTKIRSMFPTVSETHIRLLLKKYHGREAVVISALQVEKHPITTPGPFATPPPSRNMYPGVHSVLQMTPPLGIRSISRGGSPITRFGSITTSIYTDSPRIGEGFRNSSRPHSSPKLKLRFSNHNPPK